MVTEFEMQRAKNNSEESKQCDEEMEDNNDGNEKQTAALALAQIHANKICK